MIEYRSRTTVTTMHKVNDHPFGTVAGDTSLGASAAPRPETAMIRRCTDADFVAIEALINEAARAYRGVIPADCWHEPYLTRSDLLAEITAGVNFSGIDESGALIGVMGLQKVRDVALIRHAYVRPVHQGRGIGGALLRALIHQATTPLLVGTWAAAEWAVCFYERHGFRLVSSSEKDRLLKTYWNVPLRQQEASVVLMHTR